MMRGEIICYFIFVLLLPTFLVSFMQLNEFGLPLVVHIKAGRKIVLSYEKADQQHCVLVNLELVNLFCEVHSFILVLFSGMSSRSSSPVISSALC